MLMLGFRAYGGPEVLERLEVPTPAPGPGQVLVRMRAAGVNPADIKVRDGRRREAVEARFPMAVGREAAGTVVGLGRGVESLAVDDEVFGPTAAGTGALAELVLLDAAGTTRRPAAVSAQEAACIPVAVGTAYDVLAQMGLAAGSTLLVIGAGGGVGTAACQLGRDAGLTVVGVASIAKRDLVEACGATHVESGDGWAGRVRLLAPQGVDGVLDLVGTPVVEDAAALRRAGAPLVSPAAPAAATALGGGGAKRRRTTAVYAEVADLGAAGRVRPVITNTYALRDAADAVAEVETGHSAGNVVVTADA